MDTRKFRLARGFFLGAILLLFLSASGHAGVQFKSAKYHYLISLPSGWVQIPDNEVARLKQRLPPQAQHLIYDAAFQRGNSGYWFSWPYILVQVIPAATGQPPNEAEFQKLVTLLGQGMPMARLEDAVHAVNDQTDRERLTAIMQSLTSAKTVQANIANRHYQYLADWNDQHLPMKVFISGTFMPNGILVQFNSYMEAKNVKQDLIEILSITNSIR